MEKSNPLVVPSPSESAGMVKYERARQALAEAVSVDEVKELRNRFSAFEVYARQAKDTGLIEMATELKLRAERRAGELLRDMPKSVGGRPAKNQSAETTGFEKPSSPKRLADLGVTKDQSAQWQRLAEPSEQEFDAILKNTKAEAERLTTKRVADGITSRRRRSQETKAVFTASAISRGNAPNPTDLGELLDYTICDFNEIARQIRVLRGRAAARAALLIKHRNLLSTEEAEKLTAALVQARLEVRTKQGLNPKTIEALAELLTSERLHVIGLAKPNRFSNWIIDQSLINAAEQQMDESLKELLREDF